MLLVTHAYSRRNSGDGLLVDETLALATEAGWSERDVVLVALDADSFAAERPAYRVVQLGEGGPVARAAFGAVQLLPHRLRAAAPVEGPGLDELCRSAEAVLAVGGGYLRAGSAREAAKVALTHLPQLRAAAVAGDRCVYLPQSIGPLRGPVGSSVRRGLTAVRSVHVRDARSAGELLTGTRVQRTPDLAVLRIAEQWQPAATRSADGPTVVVARHLRHDEAYVAELRRLLDSLPGAVLAVQSDTRGNDDTALYRSLGATGPLPTLAEVLAGSEPGVVVSVRLHGSLQALLSGWPTVHLSYERKGFGAMADLGLDRFVTNARTVEASWVHAALADVRRDPAAYWAAVEASVPRLRAARAHLLDELAALRRERVRP